MNILLFLEVGVGEG